MYFSVMKRRGFFYESHNRVYKRQSVISSRLWNLNLASVLKLTVW